MKSLLAFAAAFLVLVLSPLTFAAGGGFSLSEPDNAIPGDTVTWTLSSSVPVSRVETVFTYDAEHLSLVELKTPEGWEVDTMGGKLIIFRPDGKAYKGSVLQILMRISPRTPVGTKSWIKLSRIAASGAEETDLTGYVSVVAPPSNNNFLARLSLEQGELSPAFQQGIHRYTAEVPFSCEKAVITAIAADSRATVSVDAPALKANAVTEVTVTVTAEDGSRRQYVIEVTRLQDPNYTPESNCELSFLSVDGYELTPSFDPNVTRYRLQVEESVTSVKILARAASEKAHISIKGADELLPNIDNEVRVICTAEDGTAQVYTILIRRGAVPTDPTENTGSDDSPLQNAPFWSVAIPAAGAAFLLLAVILLLINKKASR